MAAQYYFGDLLPMFYDITVKKIPDNALPTSQLAYITSLLNYKFGKNYSFQEVKKLLEEEIKPVAAS